MQSRDSRYSRRKARKIQGYDRIAEGFVCVAKHMDRSENVEEGRAAPSTAQSKDEFSHVRSQKSTQPRSRRNRTVPIDLNAGASTLLLRSGTAGSRAVPANTDLERSVRLYKALAAAHRHQVAAAAEQLLIFLRTGGHRRRCHPGSVLLRRSQPRVECGARRPRLSDCPPGRVQRGRWLRGERASP